MSPRFLTTARQFHLPTLAVLGLLCVCPSLSAQSPSVPKAISAKDADAHYARAETLEAKYQWASAIAEYKAAYAYDKTARPKDAATEVNNIGSAYDSLSQYDKALTYYQQVLHIQRRVGDRAGEAVTLGNIGAAYNSLSQYDKALTYLQQALAIEKEIGDTEVETAILAFIQKVQSRQSQNGKADVPIAKP
jgi:tetratricopeptide (TPR) repeat protein